MLNATVSKKIHVTPDLIILLVVPDHGVADFTPGQYVALALPGSAPRPDHFPKETDVPHPDKLIKRAYSIGSAPAVKDYLEFYIAIIPDGALTSRLVMLEEGDRVYVAPKITGTFTLNHMDPSNNLVMISTGTGIAPFMSMLRTESTWTHGRQITLVHGVRYKQDLTYRDELLELQSSNSSFKYYAVVSREESEEGIRKGYVQHLMKDGTISLNADTDHVLMCGNPAMIDEVHELLKPQGYKEHTRKSPGNLHFEKYWSEPSK